MNVLVTGAAGHVGSILRPALEAEHTCRYLDIRPIEGAEDRTVVGSVTDRDAVAQAMDGMDACIQLVMAPWKPHDPGMVDLSYDIHVKGMHRVLECARAAGCWRVIYASSLSVYSGERRVGHPRREEEPPNSPTLYGLTKRLGEEVCRAFCDVDSRFSVLAYRMVMPRTEAQWAEGPGRHGANFRTGPDDLRRVYLAGLALTDHTGFDAFNVCSDLAQEHVTLEKAARILGWRPEGR